MSGKKAPTVAIAAALFAALFAAPALAINDLAVNVAPGSESVTPGDTVSVTLDVSNLSAGINGVQALLQYDPALLTFVDALPSDLGLVPPAQGWVDVAQLDVAGDLTYVVVANGGAIALDHTVAILTFTAIGEGTASVIFRSDTLQFSSRLTRASDNSVILPTLSDSGPIAIACDDGLFCNGLEVFSAGSCLVGTPPCVDVVGCTVDTCDEVADVCLFTPNDAACSNGLFCDGAETCDPLLDCQPSTNPCVDGVGCTIDTCDEVNDACTFTPDNTACDNLQFCDGVEFCDLLLDCRSGAPPICDDLVGCTIDACDEVNDACTFTADDTACDNGLHCDGVETCDALLDCQNGAAPICDDLVGCTIDTCDEAADACTFTPDDTACDNGLFCDGVETCDALLDCQLGTDPCVDGVGCTIDSCNDVADACTFTPDDTSCDDGLFCDGAETCNALLDCQPGIAPNCDDLIACTIDTCDEVGDACTSAPDDLFCDNGLFCDGVESCDPLLDCVSSGDPCAPQLCDDVLDSCVAPPGITALELFYSGRFTDQTDPTYSFLAIGSVATNSNITNYTGGITGIRVVFDSIVTFATTPAAALTFDWTTSTGAVFSAVTNAATQITVTEDTSTGVTIMTIVLNDNHVRRRWLRVTIDALQVTVGGVELDGELIGSPIMLPSGDVIPGGDAVFHIGNVAGNVNADRKTTLSDIGVVRSLINPFLTVPITNLFDVDKSGKVVLTDVGLSRLDVNPFFTLPLLAP